MPVDLGQQGDDRRVWPRSVKAVRKSDEGAVVRPGTGGRFPTEGVRWGWRGSLYEGQFLPKVPPTGTRSWPLLAFGPRRHNRAPGRRPRQGPSGSPGRCLGHRSARSRCLGHQRRRSSSGTVITARLLPFLASRLGTLARICHADTRLWEVGLYLCLLVSFCDQGHLCPGPYFQTQEADNFFFFFFVPLFDHLSSSALKHVLICCFLLSWSRNFKKDSHFETPGILSYPCL